MVIPVFRDVSAPIPFAACLSYSRTLRTNTLVNITSLTSQRTTAVAYIVCKLLYYNVTILGRKRTELNIWFDLSTSLFTVNW